MEVLVKFWKRLLRCGNVGKVVEEIIMVWKCW